MNQVSLPKHSVRFTRALLLTAAIAAPTFTMSASNAAGAPDAGIMKGSGRLHAWMEIASVHSGKALSTLHNAADTANKGNQEPIIQYDYYGDATQKWRLESNGDGTWVIKIAQGGRALCTLHNAADPANKGNQEPIIQYDYYGDSTQKWRIEPNSDGTWIIKNVHSGKALSLLHNAADPANKGNQEPLIQYDYYGDATQKWRIVVVGLD